MHTKPVILVVDDDLLFRNLLEQQLQHIGYVPVMTASAKEAMVVIESQLVDLILSDFVMPVDRLSILTRVRRLS